MDERRRERRRRDRDRYYADEYSGGRRSQNASDREFGRRSRGTYDPQAYYQQYPYDGNYNYTQYYQQQQYFETLRRTNPQAYEWYKNYYSNVMQQTPVMQPQVPTIDDIGGSLRSGYESEKDRYELDFHLIFYLFEMHDLIETHY
jgi:hypothetical protein